MFFLFTCLLRIDLLYFINKQLESNIHILLNKIVNLDWDISQRRVGPIWLSRSLHSDILLEWPLGSPTASAPSTSTVVFSSELEIFTGSILGKMSELEEQRCRGWCIRLCRIFRAYEKERKRKRELYCNIFCARYSSLEFARVQDEDTIIHDIRKEGVFLRNVCHSANRIAFPITAILGP